MKAYLPVAAAAILALVGGVLVVSAGPSQDPAPVPAPAPKAQEEPKAADPVIKSLTEKVEKLEKRVAELEKKIAEKAASPGRFSDLFEKFGGQFEGGAEGLKKMLEEFRGSLPEMPEMPDFESMPDLFQGMDMEQLLDMLKGQFEGQMPGFFDGLDLDGLFEQFKEKLDKSDPSEPKKKGEPKRRSI